MDIEIINEAIYVFDKYCKLKKMDNIYVIHSVLPNNILTATLRILTVNNLLSYKDDKYYATDENILKIEELRQNIIEENISKEIKHLTERINTNNQFFKDLSDIEYEIYSRCNFSISFNIGHILINICNFNDATILDIGGNSGGLSTAISLKYPNSKITIVDKKIPCIIGEEFKISNNIQNINFIEKDFFSLDLKDKYDYIILSNILHDYNDDDCVNILKTCKKHSYKNTKILITEDILDNELEPIYVLEHGLRLSVNTIQGGQRTVNQLNNLMKEISFIFDRKKTINDVLSVIIYESYNQ
jgi:2-polyprenyl-3-methyl-5-hydroxy-6-metoxy-1,4-benzoquinol methylase